MILAIKCDIWGSIRLGRRYPGTVQPLLCLGSTPQFQVQEVHFIFLNQPLIGKAVIAVVADDDVVDHLHPHDFADVNQLPGQLFIAGARCGVAGGVIVDEDYGYTIIRVPTPS